jgi:Predicted membrane protein
MRALLAELPITPMSDKAEIAGVDGGVSSWWLSDCHGILYNLALIIPTVLFVAYLGSQARRSFARLTYGRSHIMIAYYALLWVVTFLNLLWCLLQVNALEVYTKFSGICLIRL